MSKITVAILLAALVLTGVVFIPGGVMAPIPPVTFVAAASNVKDDGGATSGSLTVNISVSVGQTVVALAEVCWSGGVLTYGVQENTATMTVVRNETVLWGNVAGYGSFDCTQEILVKVGSPNAASVTLTALGGAAIKRIHLHALVYSGVARYSETAQYNTTSQGGTTSTLSLTINRTGGVIVGFPFIAEAGFSSTVCPGSGSPPYPQIAPPDNQRSNTQGYGACASGGDSTGQSYTIGDTASMTVGEHDAAAHVQFSMVELDKDIPPPPAPPYNPLGPALGALWVFLWLMFLAFLIVSAIYIRRRFGEK